MGFHGCKCNFCNFKLLLKIANIVPITQNGCDLYFRNYVFQILNTVDLIERFRKSLNLLKRQKEVTCFINCLLLFI